MFKNLLFALMLFTTSVVFGNEYRIYSVQYETDESLGTFTFNNQTYGLITGITYSVAVSTGNSQTSVYEQGKIVFQNPRSVMPNENALRGLIIANINSSGAKKRIDDKLAADIARDQQIITKKTYFSDYVYNPDATTGTFVIEGAVVNLN